MAGGYVSIALILLPSLALATKYFDHGVRLPTNRSLNIAHRGHSGTYPEHSALAYRSAIDSGADVIECDVCVTKDLHLVCLHQSWMSENTNAADVLPAEKMSTYNVPGRGFITDYFTVDFTLDEIVSVVRLRQRYSTRNPNFNDLYPLVTLKEHIEIVQNSSRIVGIYPELKDPEFVNSLEIISSANTTFEDLLIQELSTYGYSSSMDPCFIQCFNEASLRYIAEITQLPLCLLLPSSVFPDNETLEELSTFLYGISPNKRLVVTESADGYILGETDLVWRAHAYGLRVHPYTFRNEDESLLWDYLQDPYLEYDGFIVGQGVDGIFTDSPQSLTNYKESLYKPALL